MDPNLNRSSLSEGWTFTSVQILDSSNPSPSLKVTSIILAASTKKF